MRELVALGLKGVEPEVISVWRNNVVRVVESLGQFVGVKQGPYDVTVSALCPDEAAANQLVERVTKGTRGFKVNVTRCVR